MRKILSFCLLLVLLALPVSANPVSELQGWLERAISSVVDWFVDVTGNDDPEQLDDDGNPEIIGHIEPNG